MGIVGTIVSTKGKPALLLAFSYIGGLIMIVWKRTNGPLTDVKKEAYIPGRLHILKQKAMMISPLANRALLGGELCST